MRNLPAVLVLAVALTFGSAGTTIAVATPVKTDYPIHAVPGTNNNEYNAGPFTVTLVHGITPGPDGDTASEILVQNTSNDFTGVATLEVEYFQGNTVLGTHYGVSDVLSRGQRETVWVYPLLPASMNGQWVDAQLTALYYSGGPGELGTRLDLAH